MPYNTTKVAWTKSRGEVEGILFTLKDKGLLKKHAWVSEGDIESLYMELELQITDTQTRHISLKFQPVMIYIEKKKGGRLQPPELNRNVSWRLFWWFFKTKMEAVLYGLETIEESFMSNIMFSLPDGREATMGEQVKQIIIDGKLGNLLENKQ